MDPQAAPAFLAARVVDQRLQTPAAARLQASPSVLRKTVGQSVAAIASPAAALLAAGKAISARRGAVKRRAAATDSAKADQKKSGRQINISNEATLPKTLAEGSSTSMDAFMRENAAEVSLQNLEKIVPKPGEPEILQCFLKPNDIGPYRSQLMMEVKVEVAEAGGKCNIHILDMFPGNVDKKTGEVTFDPQYKMDMESENIIQWTENGQGGLEVVNRAWSRSRMNLPWWFPLPDAFIEKAAQLMIRKVVKDGIAKVNEQIDTKYSAWLAREKVDA
ncbi:setd3 [Symbiodinium natans]|uniref:Setd3 protein n=1 Tax=Symbiodinium natans TaxID=878477 RepID=A0A812QA19_9DINO|nr:setd3 [Symbiodinium natans]